jgi:3-hydroxyacyl-CoA dehydrogenase
MNRNQRINQVAVLGAGVMGAQIAAHFINLKIPVFLFDLPKQGKIKAHSMVLLKMQRNN